MGVFNEWLQSFSYRFILILHNLIKLQNKSSKNSPLKYLQRTIRNYFNNSNKLTTKSPSQISSNKKKKRKNCIKLSHPFSMTGHQCIIIKEIVLNIAQPKWKEKCIIFFRSFIQFMQIFTINFIVKVDIFCNKSTEKSC